ncbi:hypothetical protein AB9X52_04825 [Enterobacter hormaechei]|uniref:hypothetical protein n=1 Tax=Enterobacter hormaechei TaxID=158836 RepID=UPI00321C5E93
MKKTCLQEGVILIDSRLSLCFLESQWTRLSSLFMRTKSIVLAIGKSPPEVDSADARPLIHDMGRGISFFILDIMEQVKNKNLDGGGISVKVEIKERDKMLVNAFMSGQPVENIAKKMNCSEKQVYKLRDRICQHLNVKNFNIACTYIFQHNLMHKSYTLPEAWLQPQ